jgi:CxxC motif-containing protein
LDVELDENEELRVTGNRCPRGFEYAKEEVFSPKRMVTATCRVAGGHFPRLPVRTTEPFPVERIGDLLNNVYALEVEAPVEIGTVLIENACGTGIDVIASRSMKAEARRAS